MAEFKDLSDNDLLEMHKTDQCSGEGGTYDDDIFDNECTDQ